MPRAKLIRSDSIPYHVTSRSNNREWFYIPIFDVWSFAKELLREGISKFNVQVDAFILMSNHYHLCIHTPDANIDKFMQFFNKNLGKKISKKAKRINRIFGAPYKWNLINNQAYYMNVIRYIYLNPVRANIVKNCLDYPFSDIKEQGFSQEEIDWINRPMNSEQIESTIRMLRRYQIN